MKREQRRVPAPARRWLGLPLPVWLGFTGVILIVAGLLFATQRGNRSDFTPEVTGSPSLKVDREVADLGEVQLGKWVEVSFELQNVGDRRLQILEKPWIEVVEGC
jgi:hypothetical protein